MCIYKDKIRTYFLTTVKNKGMQILQNFEMKMTQVDLYKTTSCGKETSQRKTKGEYTVLL